MCTVLTATRGKVRAGIGLVGAPLGGHDAGGAGASNAASCAARCGKHVGVGADQCRGWTFFGADARQRLRANIRGAGAVAAGIGLCVLKGGAQLAAKQMGDGVDSGILKHVYRR